MLTNPVVLSVLLMLGLSLARVHVVLALTLSAMLGGLLGDLGIQGSIKAFEAGLGKGAAIALSYALLGAFAVAIAKSGLTDLLAAKLSDKLSQRQAKPLVKYSVMLLIIAMAVNSQNLVPVHIAFIPILIPPLLAIFNRLKIDRRLLACCLTFGLVTTYMWLPVGFGKVFLEQLLHSNLVESGLNIDVAQLPGIMTLPAIGMFSGLVLAGIYYRKPREYQDLVDVKDTEQVAASQVSTLSASLSGISILLAFAVQLYTDSIIAGALSGFVLLQLSLRASPSKSNDWFVDGLKMMAMIGFIMIAAAGFANVMKETGSIAALVAQVSASFAGQQGLAAASMLIIGLVVTIGIGSSFSTIPIIAAIYVPLCLSLGFSELATAALVGTAAALGDAGSPASDSTLGPTAGLNADGQHDHIRDTVIPTFVFFNLPLLVFGWLAAMAL